ncbi:hypothetical protein VNO78_25697 [Psophocarpus tetragonolobus]|uniref:Uncharacterized protein n=1 Tax=Psophocarpus tetragonolobus TaxID=3891 RepID=A0AAN9S6Z0_PSOTE
MGSGHPMDCETHTFADISEQFYRNIISTVTENDWTVELEVQFLMSSRPPEAASPAGTGEPPGGPDPAAPHDRRSRLARPDRGGDRVSRAQIAAEIASRTPRSRRRSGLARPDRGRDRVSRAQIAAAIAPREPKSRRRSRFGRPLQRLFAAHRAAHALQAAFHRCVFQPCRSRRRSWLRCRVPPALAALRRAVSNPDQIPSEVGISAPPRPPAPPPSRAGFPSALVRRRSSREGGNTAGAGSAQEPLPHQNHEHFLSRRKTATHKKESIYDDNYSYEKKVNSGIQSAPRYKEASYSSYEEQVKNGIWTSICKTKPSYDNIDNYEERVNSGIRSVEMYMKVPYHSYEKKLKTRIQTAKWSTEEFLDSFSSDKQRKRSDIETPKQNTQQFCPSYEQHKERAKRWLDNSSPASPPPTPLHLSYRPCPDLHLCKG